MERQGRGYAVRSKTRSIVGWAPNPAKAKASSKSV